MSPTYDTIVIGCGAAGCAAASQLAKAGRKVLALEAQDRIGGRIHTVPFGEGVVEIGAEWIHGTENSPTYELAVKNNVTLKPQELQFQVFKSDGTLGDQELLNELVGFVLEATDEPPEKPELLGQYLTRRLKDYLREKHPKVLEDQSFVDELLRFMDLLVDNYEATNSWNDATTHTNFQKLEGHQHMSWHKNGYHTLFDILLNKYNNGPGYPNLEIQLNKEVTKIIWPRDNAEEDVVVQCKDDSIYTARNVIVTVSLGVLKERKDTLFTPPLPGEKTFAINTVSIGVAGKVLLSFDHIWWTNYPGYGFLWRKEDEMLVKEDDYWTTRVDGPSIPMGSKNVLTLWTNGNSAKLVETLPDEVVQAKVMDVLRRFMGANVTIPEPTGMLRSSWHSNPFTRGSYTYDNPAAPLYPNIRADLASPLLDNVGTPRVMFAGEATDNTHFSTVHGAIETGYREANRLLKIQSNL